MDAGLERKPSSSANGRRGSAKELRIHMRRFRAAELVSVREFESVELTSNSLCVLPPEVIDLHAHLTSLRVCWNHLETMPESISQLTRLKVLDVSYNKLARLPNKIGQLASLTRLNVSDNCLTELPASIGDLTNLQELQLQYNKLPELPASLSALTQLKSINTTGNPLHGEQDISILAGSKGEPPAEQASFTTSAHQQPQASRPEGGGHSQDHIVYNRFTTGDRERVRTEFQHRAPTMDDLQSRSRRRVVRVPSTLDSSLGDRPSASGLLAFDARTSSLQPFVRDDVRGPRGEGEPGTVAGGTRSSLPFAFFFRRHRSDLARGRDHEPPPGHALDTVRGGAARMSRRQRLWRRWAGGSRSVDADAMVDRSLGGPRAGGVGGCRCVGGDGSGGEVCSCGHGDALLCPISQSVMRDPVVAADGHSYDREAITAWLRLSDKSPMTGLPLPSKDLIPNHTLRSIIASFGS